MIRVISALFLLAGVAIAAYGGLRLSGQTPLSVPPLETPEEGPAVSRGDDRFDVDETPAPAPPPEASAEQPAAPPRPRFPGFSRSEPAESPEPTRGIGDNAAAANEPGDIFGTMTAPSSESIADQLRTVPVAYEVPQSARYGQGFDVTLAVDGTGRLNASATEALPGTDRIVESEAQISGRVKASLIGSAFEVRTLSPDVQLISPATQNVWRWRVIPLETGTHTLIVELFAMDNGEALPVRTFNGSVDVSVARLRQAITFANEANPIAMVLGGIGSALAGMFGVFRFFRAR
ncbi:MAG: hypothetical protein AAFQ67_04410 [Pseudomonadota bacterium]